MGENVVNKRDQTLVLNCPGMVSMVTDPKSYVTSGKVKFAKKTTVCARG